MLTQCPAHWASCSVCTAQTAAWGWYLYDACTKICLNLFLAAPLMEYFSGICPLKVPTSGASLAPLWPPLLVSPVAVFKALQLRTGWSNWVLPQSKAEKQNPLVLILRAALAVSCYLRSCWGWDGTGTWGRYSCWYRGRETWVVLLLLGAGPELLQVVSLLSCLCCFVSPLFWEPALSSSVCNFLLSPRSSCTPSSQQSPTTL